MNLEIINIVSEKTGIKEEYVKVVLSLFEEGCTIPFIARYRKEKTNNLDEDQIRSIEKRKIKSVVIMAFCGGGLVIFSLNIHLFLFVCVFSCYGLVSG